VESLFATPEPDEEAVAEVIGLVRDAGGLEYARRRAEQFAQEAEEALSGIPHGPARSALYDAIGYAVDRRW
jgi:octaprenyl-diphosphate synthase